MAERSDGSLPKVLEVQCGRKSEDSFFESMCQSNLAGMVPAGLKLQLCRWAVDDLHNGFVLSERGGVAILEGLDQDMGSGRTEDVVVLLDPDLLFTTRSRSSPTVKVVTTLTVLKTSAIHSSRRTLLHVSHVRADDLLPGPPRLTVII